MESKDYKVLIIIPAYNEEDSLLSTYNKIEKHNQKQSMKYDVIVINDGSTDRTKQICVENQIPTINLVHNLGIGGAVQTGYKYAKENSYDIAIQFDGDGQHEVNCIIDIITPIIEDKADFVIGSRFVDGSKSDFKSSSARRMGIRLISMMIYIVTRRRIKDVTSGFRACNKELINQFANGYPTEYPEPITNAELLKNRKRVAEVPVLMHERAGGTSSIHSWKSVYFMINILLSIFIVGIRRGK
jgi:glycosyltransferase involved in cell wall biosynthesis